jgi:glyoxylase-like metal-dependent hydrolase (beta-lactamase superfamily II)
MVARSVVAVLLTLALVTTVSGQDARSVIARASTAIGVEALRTVQFSATGYDFALGQAPNPSSPWPKFTNKSYTRAIDFSVPASQVERVRMQGENPPRGGGQQPIVGEQPVRQTIVVGGNTPWVQQLEIWMTPHGFLRAAAARNATAEARTVGGKRYQVVSFAGDNKATVNGYINEQNLVERVETWIDNAFFGDLPIEAVYSDYKDVGGGVRFPMHIVQRQGGYPTFDLRVAEVKPNAAVSIQPAAQAGAGGGGGGAQAGAASEKIGDGVYVITGGYTSIAVDFQDHILILEGGQSEARGLAVIAEAKKLIPNKPIRYVVNTHVHVDHSSGLRPFVAEGATILTHELNRAYLEKTLGAPHTLNPDAAEKAGRKPKVEAVSGDKRVLTDGTRVVELHHLRNGHHDGMLVAYFPKEKVLFEADVYNPQPTTATPPSPPSPYTLALVDFIDRLKLDVGRIVPVHFPQDGRAITLAELRRWVGRSTATQ